MANHVKIIVENATDWAFAATGETDDFVLTTGTLDPGSSLPPQWILPKATCDFTVTSPSDGPGPEGRFRYEFAGLKMRVSINWSDATSTKPGPVTTDEQGEQVVSGTVSPFSYESRLLDGGFGELDAPPVTLTADGKPVSVDQLAQFHQQDVASQVKKDKWGVPVNPQKVLVAKYTLQVKNTEPAGTPPAINAATMPKGVVRPTGGSKAVVGATFHTWDAQGISQRRKKLLAAIGNRWPQIYVKPGGTLTGSDPFRHVPYQQMTDWAPGSGTSCTSINGMVEKIFTGGSGKWAFAAYLMEEAWVPWGANPAKPMPNVGDIYILYRDVVEDVYKDVYSVPHERHCGFIVHVPEGPDDDWITADGGQTGTLHGDAAWLNRRPWEKRVPKQPTATKQSKWADTVSHHHFARPIKDTEYPYLSGGSESKGRSDANRLVGWVDLDSTSLTFNSEAFNTPGSGDVKIRQSELYTEYDYQFLGAWIDDLLGKRPNALAGWIQHLTDPKHPAPPWQPPPADPSPSP